MTSCCKRAGCYGYWPAHAEGDDIVVADTRFCFLRQQADHADGRPNRCLADYVAPAGDHLGAFAVAIHGADELSARFEAEHDDYRAIIVKALADRLAEACAEWLHLRGAPRAWYAPGEHLPLGDLLRERFRGIRPAFGYPACPDHSEKSKLFDLLGAEDAGMRLTESFAMTPAAAVSGIYLAHPQAKYFAVGRIGDDQLADYAGRKGQSARRGGTMARAEPLLIAALLALVAAGGAQANQIRLELTADQMRARTARRTPAPTSAGPAGAGAPRNPTSPRARAAVGYHPKDSDLVTTGAAESAFTNGASEFRLRGAAAEDGHDGGTRTGTGRCDPPRSSA